MKLSALELKIENIPFESSYHKQHVMGYLFTSETVAPRAILQISHGMAEYILRYQPFAAYLAAQGFVVCGNDHLGHGATSGTEYPNGFFAKTQGRDYVLADLLQMNKIVRAKYPGLPLVMFGHSMGSFFARWFVEMHPNAVDAAIICGTGGVNPLGAIGIGITTLLTKLRGAGAVSNFVDTLAFGSYNKRITNCKTKFDWLSVNEENVARYLADPKCGFPFTVSAFHELMVVLAHVNTKQWYTAVPKTLPLYIVAGGQDPVGNYGAGPREVAEGLKQVGVQDVTLQLYPEMRHEILNETEADLVCADVVAWCNRVLSLV